MIASGAALFAFRLPRETYDRIYAAGSDVAIAGSAQPAGKAEAVPEGWRVSGRWPFASGCKHADWMVGFCVTTENASPAAGTDGTPQVRGVILPAKYWQIEDTWHVAGLEGTGSHHIALKDALVSSDHFFDVDGDPCLPGPLYKAIRQTLPILHGAWAVGIAEGALGELVGLANTGRQQTRAAVPMRDSEIFQYELGRAAAEFKAARAFHHVHVASHWRSVLDGTMRDEESLVEATQSAIWIANACIRVTNTCFVLGGGSSVYNHFPLQRRLRDLHVAGQHQAVHQRHYAEAGRALLNHGWFGMDGSTFSGDK